MAEEKTLDEQISEVNTKLNDALKSGNANKRETQKLCDQSIKLLRQKMRSGK